MLAPISRRSRCDSSASTSVTSSTRGCRVCWREKASSWRTRLAARLAFCLICMMSAKDWSPARWRSSKRSQKPIIAVSRLLKSCAMPPASWPTACIFCDWANWRSSLLALGRVDELQDEARGPLALRFAAHRIKRGAALGRAGEQQVERLAAALRLGRDGGELLTHRLAVGLGDQVVEPAVLQGLALRPHHVAEGGIGHLDVAGGIDQRHAERRLLEETLEALLEALHRRLELARLGEVVHHAERSRSGADAARREGLLQERHHRAPLRALERDLAAILRGVGEEAVRRRCGGGLDGKIVQPNAPRLQILAREPEPQLQRGVHIIDAAGGIGGVAADRRILEQGCERLSERAAARRGRRAPAEPEPKRQAERQHRDADGDQHAGLEVGQGRRRSGAAEARRQESDPARERPDPRSRARHFPHSPAHRHGPSGSPHYGRAGRFPANLRFPLSRMT